MERKNKGKVERRIKYNNVNVRFCFSSTLLLGRLNGQVNAFFRLHVIVCE